MRQNITEAGQHAALADKVGAILVETLSYPCLQTRDIIRAPRRRRDARPHRVIMVLCCRARVWQSSPSALSPQVSPPVEAAILLLLYDDMGIEWINQERTCGTREL